MNAELLDFTRRALAEGIGRQEIAGALRRAGWAEAEVKAALGAFAEIDFPLPVPRPKPYLPAREVFLYLLLFASLYACAYNLGAIAFEFIDRAFGDAGEAIRWNLSSLIVSFPLFLFVFRSVTLSIASDPVKRGSRVRKWLTYLTLFFAATALAGDLVVLVYNALGGELTLRFLMKAGVVGIIAGGIFAYFLADMRQEETE
jgi:hypothetical protein